MELNKAILILFILFGCSEKKIEITKRQKYILNHFEKKFKCTSKLNIDYYSIYKKRNDGTYFVLLLFKNKCEICSFDSTKRYEIFEYVKKRIQPCLTYSKNHSKIEIELNQIITVNKGCQSSKFQERYTFHLSNDSILTYYNASSSKKLK